MDAVFHRTSVRQFQDRPVEQEKIDRLLRAGFQAPTATNQQSWKFYVVRNKEKLEQLSQASPYAGMTAKAPLAIVITAEKETNLPEYNDIDCAIATENIWLEADSLGLGGVMLGIAPFEERMQIVADTLDIPDTERVFTILPIGYPVTVREQKERYDEEKVVYVD